MKLQFVVGKKAVLSIFRQTRFPATDVTTQNPCITRKISHLDIG
jgi:hypothetical protein